MDAFGKKLVKKGLTAGCAPAREPLSFGSIGMDLASGIGGASRGSIVELYGPEGSGKTTLTYIMAGQTIANGGKVLGLYFEPFWEAHARRYGLDSTDEDSFILLSADRVAESGEEFTVERALDVVRTALQDDIFDLIIWDSIAASLTEAMSAGDFTDAHWAQLARQLSKGIPMLLPTLARSKAVLLCTNQLRATMAMFGKSEDTSGGRALKYYARMRIKVSRIKWLPSNDNPTGMRIRAKFDKNNYAMPWRRAEFDLMFGAGIPPSSELGVVDYLKEQGVLEAAGSFFKYHGETIGQGREKAMQYIMSKGIMDQLIEEANHASAEMPEGSPAGLPLGGAG